MQKRVSVYNWNFGPRRVKDAIEKQIAAIEKQIAGKWHCMTLQEVSDYVEYEIFHERFHVTHFAGCAILFNKDTFYFDISVKSIYVHDTMRGRSYCLRRTWMCVARCCVTFFLRRVAAAW